MLGKYTGAMDSQVLKHFLPDYLCFFYKISSFRIIWIQDAVLRVFVGVVFALLHEFI